jgi:hypothetical protein
MLYQNPGHGVDDTPPSEVVYGLSNTFPYSVFLHGVSQSDCYLYLYTKGWMALTSRLVHNFMSVLAIQRNQICSSGSVVIREIV